MKQFHTGTPAFVVAACFGLFCSSAHAQGLYKWTDANGKVHYGDSAAAPESSKKMHVTVTAPSKPAAVAASASSQRPPHRAPQKKSVPADPALVGPQCKGLIEKIAAVPVGTSWESLYRQFDNACPGIAYECVEYQSTPQNNQCLWIKRSGSRVLNRNKYP